MDRSEIINRFTYHPPFGTQADRYEEIRDLGKKFALRLYELCPTSDELKKAIDHIDDAIKEANASIARHEEPDQ